MKSPAVLLAIGCIAIVSQSAIAQLTTTQKADIGFTDLQILLGGSMPTGAGISVSQVEAPSAGNYRPDAAVFPTKNFTYPSGGATGVSSHATTVGKYFYGSSSLAPDIGTSPNRVTSYEVNGYLSTNFLQTSSTSALPSVEVNDIQNHSWVGSLSTEALNIDAIRRIDYAIQRDDFIGVFGLNNASNTTVPSLMAGAYNGITVGRSDGEHSQGGIALDGGLRTRPDIVVPTTATSWAAPTVGSAAAVLLETARGTAGLTDASRSVVVKSLLMTGATRDEPEFGGAWSHSSSQPLDEVYGAGELNVLNSHGILVEGQNNASSVSTVAATGWDLGSSNSTTPQLYFFDLDQEGYLHEIAASLVWNRDITVIDNQAGPLTDYSFTPTLANLNLELYSATGFTLGEQLNASLSTVDNVELIVAQNLASGRYAWRVSADTNSVDYGLSWNIEGLTIVPEPSILSMAAFAGLLLIVRKRR